MTCPICGAAHTACPGTVPAPQFIVDLEVHPMADNQWTSDRRLYLNAEGKVVEESDASRVSLLIAKGGTMALSLAEQYGLTGGEKAKAPTLNKAKAPGENK